MVAVESIDEGAAVSAAGLTAVSAVGYILSFAETTLTERDVRITASAAESMASETTGTAPASLTPL